jgi:hypothetical protein
MPAVLGGGAACGSAYSDLRSQHVGMAEDERYRTPYLLQLQLPAARPAVRHCVCCPENCDIRAVGGE